VAVQFFVEQLNFICSLDPPIAGTLRRPKRSQASPHRAANYVLISEHVL
jgi:hypothetical protein